MCKWRAQHDKATGDRRWRCPNVWWVVFVLCERWVRAAGDDLSPSRAIKSVLLRVFSCQVMGGSW